MSLLDILVFPDTRLRNRAKPVLHFDDALQTIVNNMFETMYDAPGIGLAATQVDIQKKIIVMDLSENKNEPICLINPEIIASEGESEYEEGCLSVPGFYEKVRRKHKITVKTLNTLGESSEFETDGLLATCIQHEMDHLEGKLFVDYLSNLKRHRIRKKLEKQKKQHKE